MKFYMAPMEGITGYIFRNAYHQFFHPMDKYYTPFISPNNSKKLMTRELLDILPENNRGLMIVPQILTNCAEDFIRVAFRLKALGYEEINLNLGCPSAGVAGKGKGAGFLARPDELNRFLDEIFSALEMNISVKSRLGLTDSEEIYQLLDIYNRYPLHELILHPRIQRDFYNEIPDVKMFGEAVKASKNRLCYNGDIYSAGDYCKLRALYPQIDAVMLGRGILRNPGLLNIIQGSESGGIERIRQFHNQLFADYCQILRHERAVMAKMKELWFYLGNDLFAEADQTYEIKRTRSLKEYEKAAEQLFDSMLQIVS